MIPLHDDNPTRIFPIITLLLIASCVAIFLYQISLPGAGHQIILRFGVIPAALFDKPSLPHHLTEVPAWITPISSMFLHAGWMHLIGNMLYLWIFGNNIEDAMGHKRFVFFYSFCGIAAAFSQAMLTPDSQIPMIGASGAISGVLGAYLLLFPHARVLVAIPLGIIIHTARIPASIVLLFWFILQIINAYLLQDQTGGVAWGAHIGGFVAGVILIPLFKYKRVRLFAPKRRH